MQAVLTHLLLFGATESFSLLLVLVLGGLESLVLAVGGVWGGLRFGLDLRFHHELQRCRARERAGNQVAPHHKAVDVVKRVKD